MVEYLAIKRWVPSSINSTNFHTNKLNRYFGYGENVVN